MYYVNVLGDRCGESRSPVLSPGYNVCMYPNPPHLGSPHQELFLVLWAGR